MPIPDTPYTRKEAYLNAVATGDSSGIPETPYTREEMYLKAIAENSGGGGGGGGSSTLSGLTDVDISNPTDGQTLVYDAASSKWFNGSGGGDVFVTLGTISADTVPMTYDEESQVWIGDIHTDIPTPSDDDYAGRNLSLTIGGNTYSVAAFAAGVNEIQITETEVLQFMFLATPGSTLDFSMAYEGSQTEPVITNLSAEVYAPSPDLAVFLGGGK